MVGTGAAFLCLEEMSLRPRADPWTVEESWVFDDTHQPLSERSGIASPPPDSRCEVIKMCFKATLAGVYFFIATSLLTEKLSKVHSLPASRRGFPGFSGFILYDAEKKKHQPDSCQRKVSCPWELAQCTPNHRY